MKKKRITNKRILPYVAGILILGQFIRFGEAIPDLTLLSSVESKTFAYEAKGIESVDYSKNLEKVKEHVETTQVDQAKVRRVYNYLSKRRSPLAAYSEKIVTVSEEYGLDFRLIPAISIVESSGGIHAYRPYNAWGWGGSNGYSFSSWNDSIETVARGLYRYKISGRVTPQQIAPTYNPHTPTDWSRKVSYIMSQI